MTIRFLTNLEARPLLLASLILCFISGVFSSGVVILKSIQIFNTHEWFNVKPTVYFHCKRENKTIFPDVTKAHVVYTFKGEESWQPLTELPDNKCKRCGLYEMGTLFSDDVFDEWEFCSDDFIDGNYVLFKDKEFNATFLCPKCLHLKNSSDHASGSRKAANKGKRERMSVLLVILVSFGVVAAYRYWQWRNREQDHAEFLKLSEVGDDIEDELGVGQVL